MTLEKRSKTPPSPTKCRNGPALVEKVATLTNKVAELERLILLPAPQQSWAQVANRKAPKAKPATLPTPAAPVKRDRTLIITRDGTSIPNDALRLLFRNFVNAGLPKPLIAEVRCTTRHHIQLIAVAETTSDNLLKSRTTLEEIIRTAIPSATSLQKEVQAVQVVFHNNPTTIPSTGEGYIQVQTEVQSFNHDTTFYRTPAGSQGSHNGRASKCPAWSNPSLDGDPPPPPSRASSSLDAALKLPTTSASMKPPNALLTSSIAPHAPDSSLHLPEPSAPGPTTHGHIIAAILNAN
ncbi:hypothetical protein Q9L58_010574 [Maublancomyces gigas]|uniref:Gag-like protein n=1 Tax=Discina gigas TaxID=1032678 RepID=A0ABR3G469_9PEZI